MITNYQLNEVPEAFDEFVFVNEAQMQMPYSEQSPYVGCGLEVGDTSLSIDLHNYVVLPSPNFDTQIQSSSNESAEIKCLDDNGSDSIFKFLDQILMEDNIDEKPSMLHGLLALQATEKSFSDIIDKKYPPSPSIDYPTYVDMYGECPRNLLERTCETNGNSVDPSWIGDPGDYDFPVGQFHSSNGSIQPSFISSQPLVHAVNGSKSCSGGHIESFVDINIISNLFGDSESMLQFRKGMEEDGKFLPTNSELFIVSDNETLAPNSYKEPPKVEDNVNKNHFPSTRGKKHLHRQDSDLDTRSRKQSAIYMDEIELSDLFDKVLLRDVEGVRVTSKGDVKFVNGIDKYFQQNILQQVPRNLKLSNKKKGKESNAVDLQHLLVSCAQAAASDDLRTAREQLKQIRHYASSIGDACQRVANVFANGLEARLDGTGSQMYAALASKRISATEYVKAYQVYLSACPFKEIAIVYSVEDIIAVGTNQAGFHSRYYSR